MSIYDIAKNIKIVKSENDYLEVGFEFEENQTDEETKIIKDFIKKFIIK